MEMAVATLVGIRRKTLAVGALTRQERLADGPQTLVKLLAAEVGTLLEAAKELLPRATAAGAKRPLQEQRLLKEPRVDGVTKVDRPLRMKAEAGTENMLLSLSY